MSVCVVRLQQTSDREASVRRRARLSVFLPPPRLRSLIIITTTTNATHSAPTTQHTRPATTQDNQSLLLSFHRCFSPYHARRAQQTENSAPRSSRTEAKRSWGGKEGKSGLQSVLSPRRKTGGGRAQTNGRSGWDAHAAAHAKGRNAGEREKKGVEAWPSSCVSVETERRRKEKLRRGGGSFYGGGDRPVSARERAHK